MKIINKNLSNNINEIIYLDWEIYLFQIELNNFDFIINNKKYFLIIIIFDKN